MGILFCTWSEKKSDRVGVIEWFFSEWVSGFEILKVAPPPSPWFKRGVPWSDCVAFFGSDWVFFGKVIRGGGSLS
jgi:hypothetical protein